MHGSSMDRMILARRLGIRRWAIMIKLKHIKSLDDRL
jgi:hypothetical protein